MKILLYLAALILLSSCSSKDKIDPDDALNAHELYSKAKEYVKNKKYKDAAKVYSKIYFKYPGSDKSAKAELGEAYCLYKTGKYAEANDILENFFYLHPSHHNIQDARYLHCLSYYEQMTNIYRDQTINYKAIEALQHFVNMANDGDIRKLDAQQKIIILKDRIDAHEMHIGRYYLFKNNPIAAINRFQKIANNPHSLQREEALKRVEECKKILGIISVDQNKE